MNLNINVREENHSSRHLSCREFRPHDLWRPVGRRLGVWEQLNPDDPLQQINLSAAANLCYLQRLIAF